MELRVTHLPEVVEEEADLLKMLVLVVQEL
jgi:hypothetical protein